MRTIQEKITEILVKQTYGIFEDPVYDAIFEIIEFMQNMIEFTEELPPRNEKILVKTKHNEYHTFIFTGNCDIKTSAEYMSLVSWRPLFYNIEKIDQDEN